jgi:hypothetical protein
VSASVIVPLGLIALIALFVARKVKERRMRPAHADPQAPAEA